ncbi:hypothetical protein EYF80_048560 [Liparis tanakae]|uniref:Uncharacterized protein n=1 Tax=Liparis tanakae TaxID=230148 RepID=A0A4Z2FJZ7_9TELE|nr:hypothetical protein EYF80_048560 [Liparis tanakae]
MEGTARTGTLHLGGRPTRALQSRPPQGRPSPELGGGCGGDLLVILLAPTTPKLLRRRQQVMSHGSGNAAVSEDRRCRETQSANQATLVSFVSHAVHLSDVFISVS